jgi:hypothetical protein
MRSGGDFGNCPLLVGFAVVPAPAGLVMSDLGAERKSDFGAVRSESDPERASVGPRAPT